MDVALRVFLPVQNLRSSTRTVRFSLVGKLPFTLQADNAVVVIKVPTTSPKPMVIVPKDAVLPVTGGHLVYLAEGGRAKRQIIQIGAAVEGGFIVRQGLSPGQKVVVRGMNSYQMAGKSKLASQNLVREMGKPSKRARNNGWHYQTGY